MAAIRKLKKYKPTIFKADGSVYDKDAADNAVSFINCLKHTKGEWYGQPFELIDWHISKSLKSKENLNLQQRLPYCLLVAILSMVVKYMDVHLTDSKLPLFLM